MKTKRQKNKAKKFLRSKEKILSGIFALALLATAGFGVQKSMKSDAGLSDLALMNVEALARGESGGSYDCGSYNGAYCATFTAADTGITYKVYYKS
jgi:hypothetical protein